MKTREEVDLWVQSFFTSALDISNQLYATTALPLRKYQKVPSGSEAGWTKPPVWTLAKKLTAFAENRIPIVQPAAWLT
jgi:hypothetical protein